MIERYTDFLSKLSYSFVSVRVVVEYETGPMTEGGWVQPATVAAFTFYIINMALLTSPSRLIVSLDVNLE